MAVSDRGRGVREAFLTPLTAVDGLFREIRRVSSGAGPSGKPRQPRQIPWKQATWTQLTRLGGLLPEVHRLRFYAYSLPEPRQTASTASNGPRKVAR